MLKVSKILRDGSAVVSTRGLRRIVDEAGKIINEFIPADRAQHHVEFYNSMFKIGESWARSSRTNKQPVRRFDISSTH